MFSRKLFDITWKQLIYGATGLVNCHTAEFSNASLEVLWVPHQTFVSLSVRTSFDICLQACDFPPGSEIILSAITLPDMVRIITLHNLVPVPVDLQRDASVSADDISKLVTSKTKAILIAQLFGSRKSLSAVAKIAQDERLLLIEDCAQAFCGTDFVGSPEADISMFSFGPIKTSTAMGGSISTVRNASLLFRMQAIQEQYPLQSGMAFLQRIAKYALLKAVSDSAYLSGVFIKLLHFLGKDHHQVMTQLSHSLKKKHLLSQIRLRPSTALVRLLHHRIATFDSGTLELRTRRVAQLASLLPEKMMPVGFIEQQHHYWLCPVRVHRPRVLITSLLSAGFDCADGGTSISVATLPNGQSRTPRATEMMKEIVYVPIDHDFDSQTLSRLASVFQQHHESSSTMCATEGRIQSPMTSQGQLKATI